MTQDREDGKTAHRAGGKARRPRVMKARKKSAPEAAPRGGGFRQAANRARPVLDRVAGQHGFARTDVLTRWAEIVGEALAPTCRPVKVSHGSKRGLGATLTVRAGGARALEVEHLAPRIIERVNGFYGYRAISRLRIVQGGAAGFAEAQAGFKGSDHSPTPADTERAAELAAGIEDTGLRAAVTRLGAHVLARSRGPIRE